MFYYRNKPDYGTPNTEYVEYSDIIMYKYFYRLLEEIDNDTLVVVDNCLRTRNRNDLTYNCLKHYLNQTQHRLILNDLPFIEDVSDTMILADLNAPGKYKGVGFSADVLPDLRVQPIHFQFSEIMYSCTDKQVQEYIKQKEKLFDTLGNKDPDTIPRALQIVTGNFKKVLVEADKSYIARNKRHGLSNVYSYADDIKSGDYIVIDTHYSRMHMIDFLLTSEMTDIRYLSTELGIDRYIASDFRDWIKRLEGFYAQTNLY